jgi:hypothetical protein
MWIFSFVKRRLELSLAFRFFLADAVALALLDLGSIYLFYELLA